MPEEVDPRDEHFDPRRGPIYVRGEAAEPKRKVLSWLPTRGVQPAARLYGPGAEGRGSSADPRAVLSGCWRFLESLRDGWLASDPRWTARRRPPGGSHLAAARLWSARPT